MRKQSATSVRRMRIISAAVALVCLTLSLLFQASPAMAQTSPAGEAEHAAKEDPGALPTITLTGPKGEQATVNAADIATLPRRNITVYNKHSGVSESYGGVLLSEVLKRLNAPLGSQLHGKGLAMYVIATGADRYSAVYSLAELDPAFHPGSVLIADVLNGQVLPTKQGPLQLVNTEDKRPARWVRQLVAIHLVATE